MVCGLRRRVAKGLGDCRDGGWIAGGSGAMVLQLRVCDCIGIRGRYGGRRVSQVQNGKCVGVYRSAEGMMRKVLSCAEVLCWAKGRKLWAVAEGKLERERWSVGGGERRALERRCVEVREDREVGGRHVVQLVLEIVKILCVWVYARVTRWLD